MPQDHDLLAELAGYRVEHHHLATSGKTDRGEAVAGEIDRVSTAIAARASELEETAAQRLAEGADGAAVELQIEARRYRVALEDAADSAPRERAVTKRKTTS